MLHPKTIAPIAQFQIPCLIKNSFNPQGAGTLIGQDTGEDKLAIKGITTLSNLTMVNVSGPGMKGMVGMASRVFGAMSAADVSIVLITQSSSEYSISFCIEAQHKALAQQALADAFELELKDGLLGRLSLSITSPSSRWLVMVCVPLAVSRRNFSHLWPKYTST